MLFIDMRVSAILRPFTALVSVCLLFGLAADLAGQDAGAGLIRAADLDRDGLADDFENALLARFLPSFRISEDDCDVRPAEFLSGSRNPLVAGRNGTIYGQVFRKEGGPGTLLEMHYYHLWSRDCGRIGHALDVEHVSVLLQAGALRDLPEKWKAVYWYAAAHEDTVCDISHGATAAFLGAVDRGPDVWISSGKHASFLDRSLCGRGCGADRCDKAELLDAKRLVNIGEPGAPMSGAVWIESEAWRLSAKMTTDFGAEVISQIDAAPSQTATLTGSPRSTRAIIRAGNSTVNAIAASDRNTEAALSSASRSTDQALSLNMTTIAVSLQRAQRAVKRALRFGIK